MSENRISGCTAADPMKSPGRSEIISAGRVRDPPGAREASATSPICRKRQGKQSKPCHSITSSARASMTGGTLRPRAFAVLRLMTSLNLVGCWTGRSPGFLPRNMRSM